MKVHTSLTQEPKWKKDTVHVLSSHVHQALPEVHWFLVAKEVHAHTSGALLLKQHSLLPILSH